MIPLLVEYSENDDTGCGFSMIVMTCTAVVIVLLVRLATVRARQ